MDKKRFPILVVVALLAVVVAAVLVFKRAPETEGSLSGGALLPALSDQLNEIEQIQITGAGDKTLVTVNRSGERWAVAEREGYPADAGKVRSFLLRLADARVNEAKTANPERYAQLGVQDVADGSAAGVRLALSGGGYEDSIIIGNTAGLSGGTYARHADEPTSVLVGGELNIDREPGQWLQPAIIDIASSRIREIELAIGDGAPLRVAKESPGDANFAVADVPRGRQVQSDFVANGMGSMLAALTLEDVARDTGGVDAEHHRGVYRLFDGIVINLDGWKEGEDSTWIRLSASLDEAAATATVAADVAREQADAQALAQANAAAEDAAGDKEEGADGDEAATAEPATAPVPVIDVEARTSEKLAELRAEVEAINAVTEGWRFKIPAFKFDPINKRMDDMLQAVD